MRKGLICLAVACAVLLFAGGSFSQEEQEKAAKALFEGKCGLCHKLPAGKQKTLQEWESSVLRMKTRNGAPIKDEEAKVLIGYLAKTQGKKEK
jgi:hypothetical protein